MIEYSRVVSACLLLPCGGERKKIISFKNLLFLFEIFVVFLCLLISPGNRPLFLAYKLYSSKPVRVEFVCFKQERFPLTETGVIWNQLKLTRCLAIWRLLDRKGYILYLIPGELKGINSLVIHTDK